MDEDPVDPLHRDGEDGELVPRLVRLADEDVSEAHGDSRRRAATPPAVVPHREEQRPELRGERVPAEREELDQYDGRIVAGEDPEENGAALGQIRGIGSAPVGQREGAGRLVGGGEGRQRHDLGATEIEPRHGPPAGDEHDVLAGRDEGAGEPRGALHVAEAEQVLAVEEDGRTAHGSRRSGSFSVTS